MNTHDRQVFVARHPGPAAQYFDRVIKSFIQIILKCKASGDNSGLFGDCTAYYGMVEAQGRGTLHCHMLVWLAGNPSPQDLRDRMADNPEFQSRMFSWIESIISCQLPGMTEPSVETCADDAKQPKPPPGWKNPQLSREPLIGTMTDELFEERFRDTVTALAKLCNWHEHTHTCWKHVKPGKIKDDTSCRMRIDGKTRALTELDDETKSIMIKRLHPRINNYNEFVIFLLRCNMDIKYVGSGEAAKALVYYVTDYITKSTLPTHVGLAAIEYAIKMNKDKFEASASSAAPPSTESVKDRSLFTKTVMAIMSKQEMSHQQVMSYLIGGGDNYCSHTFKTVRWGDFDRAMTDFEGTPSMDIDDIQVDFERAGGIDDLPPELAETAEPAAVLGSSDVLLRMDGESLEIATDVADYQFRPDEIEFERMSVWEHSEWTCKISLASEKKRL
ncbi:hypothetical protein C8R44DRAFT_614209, partial [Mycena epipterygia]